MNICPPATADDIVKINSLANNDNNCKLQP